MSACGTFRTSHDHDGHDLRADPPAHAVRARIPRVRMKRGMVVLCTASPFKNTFARSCIQYCGVAGQLAVEFLR
jgi:hypothetical protein